MKQMRWLLVITLAYGSLALAQQRTEIEITDGQITGAKQVQVPVPPAMPTFAEADANGDGCVSRQEALNVGILPGDFNKFARKGCLNEAAYQDAAHF